MLIIANLEKVKRADLLIAIESDISSIEDLTVQTQQAVKLFPNITIIV